jgi:CMP-N-acetylneuraminic acid synthetase
VDGEAEGGVIVGLIPARGGSKRLPGKNLLCVGGVSLLQRAIDTAIESGLDTCVTTDSDEIAAAANQVSVVRRPAELADDAAEMVDVALHASEEMGLERDDVIVLLQPTSPFRSAETIRRAVGMFSGNPVVSVSRVKLPEHAHSLVGEMLVPASVVTPNGCVYVASVSFLRLYRSFTLQAKPLFVSDQEALDIDTREQWIEARMLVEPVTASPYGVCLVDA